MCGIVGYVGKRPVIDVVLRGLKQLEYRGYDSAGVAFWHGDHIDIKKSEGKIANVEKLLSGVGTEHQAVGSHCGMGHTRWATHGKPTTQNAHPHRTGHVVVVHNGIIENYQKIKADLISRGHRPASETDSELYGFLVLEEMEKGKSLMDAVRTSFTRLEGACGFVVMSEKEPGTIICIRNGSPLVVATDPNGGAIFASDAQPILPYTQEVIFMENGDMAVATQSGLKIYDYQSGKEVKREVTRLDWSVETTEKQGYAHYMLKEIHEQPNTIVDTLNSVLDRARTDPFPLARQPGEEILRKADCLTFVACGTSWYAALQGKYWLERWAGISVAVEYASEFRYRDPVLPRNTVIVGISQSGETADTLAVIRDMRKRGVPTLAITNVRGSTISRESDATFFTSAGPEIGVAATKSFMAQLVTVFLWAGFLGLQRGRDTAARIPALFDELIRLPHVLEGALRDEKGLTSTCKKVATQLADAKGFFFIGRGYSYPIAMEGALKLKEIAYIHAEGYAAGELKHGPIAMIDEGMVVVTLAPKDVWRDKTVSNLQEVKARGAIIVGVGNPDDEELKSQCDHWIPIPMGAFEGTGIDESMYPFLLAPVVQLLSYELAVMRGTDVDKPRNLAKSVTVE